MKPDIWDDMDQQQKRDYAWDLMNSLRGYLLMNDALLTAAAVSRNHGAESNAEDLDSIREALFPINHERAEVAEVEIGQLEWEEE